MNERITKLAEQAGLFDFVIESMGINEELEKFAEMIVRECAEQVKNLRVNDYGISGAEIIREHFGVIE